jgi:hypothetical protein
MTIPTGTEIARPFLPAQDFEKSRAFYETLGLWPVVRRRANNPAD